MHQSYNYNLALPPRAVPWLVRSQVLFGGTVNQLGWVFFGLGLIFVWGFGRNADLSFWRFHLNNVDTAQGVVQAVEDTNTSENDRPVYAYDYTFRIERLETEYTGVSYATGRPFEMGQVVTVEYIESEPAVSRIEGMRGAVFSPWVICIVSIFPLIGLGFIISGGIQGLKANRLLEHGKIGLGKQLSMVPTNTRVNKKQVYKLTFEFTADNGNRYEVVAKTHLPHLLDDEAQERLLYDPANPAYAVMLDSLPGSPHLDDMGRFQAPGFAAGSGVLILPLLALASGGAIFLLMLF